MVKLRFFFIAFLSFFSVIGGGDKHCAEISLDLDFDLSLHGHISVDKVMRCIIANDSATI